MFEIKYEIKLNDNGRPCVDLPEDYEDKPEDKFFAIEIARYFLQQIYGRMKSPPYDQNTIDMTDISIRLLGQIGDEMARIQWHNMKNMGDMAFLMGNQDYHVLCDTIEERNNISEKGIVYYGKLYVRQEGLRVFTQDDTDGKWKVFELKGGITNDDWKIVE